MYPPSKYSWVGIGAFFLSAIKYIAGTRREASMIYFLVTTSYGGECSFRQSQYDSAITRLKEVLDRYPLPPYQIILLENNGYRETFLDSYPFCRVFYTNNNLLPDVNIGYKELRDIHDCIQHFGIRDDDFIVKMTGRYMLQHHCPFIDAVCNNQLDPMATFYNYDCILRYGSFDSPVGESDVCDDCVTGFIGMKCFFVKQIDYPADVTSCVEWNWAKTTHQIESRRRLILPMLGIDICPAGREFFSV